MRYLVFIFLFNSFIIKAQENHKFFSMYFKGVEKKITNIEIQCKKIDADSTVPSNSIYNYLDSLYNSDTTGFSEYGKTEIKVIGYYNLLRAYLVLIIGYESIQFQLIDSFNYLDKNDLWSQPYFSNDSNFLLALKTVN